MDPNSPNCPSISFVVSASSLRKGTSNLREQRHKVDAGWGGGTLRRPSYVGTHVYVYVCTYVHVHNHAPTHARRNRERERERQNETTFWFFFRFYISLLSSGEDGDSRTTAIFSNPDRSTTSPKPKIGSNRNAKVLKRNKRNNSGQTGFPNGFSRFIFQPRQRRSWFYWTYNSDIARNCSQSSSVRTFLPTSRYGQSDRREFWGETWQPGFRVLDRRTRTKSTKRRISRRWKKKNSKTS